MRTRLVIRSYLTLGSLGLFNVLPAHAEAPQVSQLPAAQSAPKGVAAPIGRHFNDAARWAKEFDNPSRDARQKPSEIVSAMQVKPGMTVVDLGAGTGYLVPHLLRAVGASGQVVALDVEASMVKYLNERSQREGWKGVQARQVPVSDPQLPALSVDRIVVLDVWHHIPARVEYAKLLFAGLKAGGSVYIVDFTKESRLGPPKQHRLSSAQVQEELRTAGFSAEVVTEPLPDHYIVAGRKIVLAGQK